MSGKLIVNKNGKIGVLKSGKLAITNSNDKCDVCCKDADCLSIDDTWIYSDPANFWNGQIKFTVELSDEDASAASGGDAIGGLTGSGNVGNSPGGGGPDNADPAPNYLNESFPATDDDGNDLVFEVNIMPAVNEDGKLYVAIQFGSLDIGCYQLLASSPSKTPYTSGSGYTADEISGTYSFDHNDSTFTFEFLSD